MSDRAPVARRLRHIARPSTISLAAACRAPRSALPRTWRIPLQRLDLRRHELAGQRRDVRPLHLPRPDALRRRRCSPCRSTSRPTSSRPGFSPARGRPAVRDPAAAAVDRGARRRRDPRLRTPAAGASRPRRRRRSSISPSSASGQSAMVTLSSIVIAVPLGVVGGVLLGIAGFRAPRFRKVLVPILDGMQTVPVFAYLRADPDPLRLQPGLGADRHHHLRACRRWCASPCWRSTTCRRRSSSSARWPAAPSASSCSG